jgi:hypothetical protein
VANRGEDSDLVESVLFLFGAEVAHLYPFEGINLVVLQSEHLVDGGVGSVAEFGHYLEVLDRHASLFLGSDNIYNKIKGIHHHTISKMSS